MYVKYLEGVFMKPVHCDENLVIIETLLEKDRVVPKHSHESMQLSMVLKGSMVFGIEGMGEKVVRQGDYTIIPHGVLHWAKALEPTLVLDINWPLTKDRLELFKKIGGECTTQGNMQQSIGET